MGKTAALQVSGVCPECKRTITKDAPAGRLTWRGDCPYEGCNGRVYAKRQRAGAAAPPAPAGEPANPPAAAAKRTARKVVKVDDYQRRPGQCGGAAGVPAADRRTAPPEGSQQPVNEPAKPPVGAADPPHAAEPETRGTGRRGHPYGDLFSW